MITRAIPKSGEELPVIALGTWQTFDVGGAEQRPLIDVLEEGTLLRNVRRRPLPDRARDYGAESWSELFLRWIVSHPAVTCVIPATGNAEHMSENLRAGEGRILSMKERRALRIQSEVDR